MPMLNGHPDEWWVDPDLVPRPVLTFGVDMDLQGAFELEPHTHAKAQVLLALRGVISCEVDGGLWIVPPQSALWIPGGETHAIRIAGKVQGYGAFVDAANARRLPTRCCAIAATPLLRELLARAAQLPVLYPDGGLEEHLVTLLIDEIAATPVGDLHLPMPTDSRLRAIVSAMLAEPAAGGAMSSWAERAGMSERTFARRLSRETGMSFSRWRQRINVMLALQWLAEGQSIQQVSSGLGYESANSFVTQFRKVLGVPPGRYMAERRALS
jgi:AraC-like DNA-binding protein